MASRFYKAGTIVSRTKDLLDAGVSASCPLWLDVIEALPPITSPAKLNEKPKPGKPSLITFPTDIEIQKFHQNYVIKRDTKSISLFEVHLETASSTAKRFIDTQKQHATEMKDKKGVEEQGVEPPTSSSEVITKVGQRIKLPTGKEKKGEELPTGKQKGVERKVKVSKGPVLPNKERPRVELNPSLAAITTLKRQNIIINSKEKVINKRESATDVLLEFLDNVDKQKQ